MQYCFSLQMMNLIQEGVLVHFWFAFFLDFSCQCLLKRFPKVTENNAWHIERHEAQKCSPPESEGKYNFQRDFHYFRHIKKCIKGRQNLGDDADIL